MVTMRSSGWVPLTVGVATVAGWALVGLGLVCLGVVTYGTVAKARATVLVGLPLGVVLILLGVALIRAH